MKRLSIVYQTHWDREWYYTVDTYLIRLKRVLARVLNLLDDSQIESFVFDGQVRALEDYLSVCEPSEATRILTYVKSGRIVIGPWYVLADEFLVSGESLLRNLEIGIHKATRYGGYQAVGYLPDSFGHVSQMPQILKQFGLDQAVLWRGVVPDDVFFQWQAANNDQVFALYLKEGYYQPVIEQERYRQLFDSFIQKLDTFSKQDHHILTNGGDHLMPALADIPSRLEELAESHQIEIETTTYESYLNQQDKQQQIQVIQGELRDNQGIYVLPNVLSTRYYLKQQNRILESRMKTLEALIAKAHLFEPYSNQRLVDTMWETLLLNHPHDSICGCSIDDVHTEMETRSMKLNHQLDSLEHELFHSMGAYSLTNQYDHHPTKMFDDDTLFSITNPTTRRINEFTIIRLFLNKANPVVDHFQVSDGSRIYTTVILNKQEARRFTSPLDDAPQFRTGYDYEVAFRVRDLQGLGANRYTLVSGTPEWMIVTPQTSIQNDLVAITVEGDSLSITNLETNETLRGLHTFESSLDAGDEYNYSQPKQDVLSKARIAQVAVRTSTTIQEMEITYELTLPANLNDSFDGPSDTTVTNTIVSRLRLFPGRSSIDVDTTITNNAKQHRLRLLFQTNIAISRHYSDTAFDIVERSVREEQFEAPKQREVPVVVDPSLSFIALDNHFRFDHIGLHEYQVIPQSDSSALAITMIRSVGHLSRDDMRSRGGGAGPSFETPDAQMIGQYSYRYRFDAQASSLSTSNDVFLQGILVSKGHVNLSESLLQVDNELLHVSSLRKDSNGIELRVYNPTDTIQHCDWSSSYPIASVVATNALKQPIPKSVRQVKPKEILTLQIRLQPIPTIATDVLIVGASLGGVQAAISLLEQGRNVILTEANNWIGGQLTSQAVPLDEHEFIEEFGCTARYRAFRNAVRTYYSTKESLREGLSKDRLNPGNAWVTRLSFEPAVAHKLLQDLLQPYIGKQLTLLTNTIAVDARVQDDVVEEVTLQDKSSAERLHVRASYVIDGTDQGDLLPLTNTEYLTGRESKAMTNERHATDTVDSQDLQPVTHVVAMKWDDQSTTPIERPRFYDYFRSLQTPYSEQPVLSEYGPDSSTGKERKFQTYNGRLALWRYRRFYDPTQFDPPTKPEMTTINWPQNDYFLGNVFDDEYDDIHLQMAKELTWSFVYYLQTEVPRHDGGTGYPEMQIARDALGTNDGFAQTPYVRESRRIVAMKTVREQDVSAKDNDCLPHVEDSIGIGCYHIDLHITTKSHAFFFDNTWPFEIPLGAMIPIRVKNLIPACKNIGTTHLTNGCFRLHPVEWNIGEVAGYLVDYLMSSSMTPQQLYANKPMVQQFQEHLVSKGIELSWPTDKVKVI